MHPKQNLLSKLVKMLTCLKHLHWFNQFNGTDAPLSMTTVMQVCAKQTMHFQHICFFIPSKSTFLSLTPSNMLESQQVTWMLALQSANISSV